MIAFRNNHLWPDSSKTSWVIQWLIARLFQPSNYKINPKSNRLQGKTKRFGPTRGGRSSIRKATISSNRNIHRRHRGLNRHWRKFRRARSSRRILKMMMRTTMMMIWVTGSRSGLLAIRVRRRNTRRVRRSNRRESRSKRLLSRRSKILIFDSNQGQWVLLTWIKGERRVS